MGQIYVKSYLTSTYQLLSKTKNKVEQGLHFERENQEDIAIPVKTMTPFPTESQEYISHPVPDFLVQALQSKSHEEEQFSCGQIKKSKGIVQCLLP